ncbi:TBC1 domain family member 15 [Chrysoperla carnea]|uniref:TBC1 domain family member 15 n=1 Tax=Chrysoperla carnea TaxID=189513 RepID=UPI001D060E9B|nr:TBC1 domain family member 15 [Chrysoperla carnea]
MTELPLEHGMELYVQDGVLLKSASASHLSDVNTTGTLGIVEYLNTNGTRFIEWKRTDITVDSEIQDQEWAVVNTIGQRARTLSGSSQPSAEQTTKRVIRLNTREMKSFRLARNSHLISFTNKDGSPHSSFFFQHGNGDRFISALKELLPTIPSRKDRNLYLIVDHPDTQVLGRSFAELDLFPGNTSDFVWKFVKNFPNRPYETTMEAFSKLTDIVYRGPDQRYMDEEVVDLLNRSLTNIDETTSTQTQGEFEVVAHVPKPPPLPPRPVLPRGCPLTLEQWRSFQDDEGRIHDVERLKEIIFRGGITHAIRYEVWKYLLNFYPWDATHTEKEQLHRTKVEEYFTMKLQWRSMTTTQENNFSDYRDRKSLIEKDVNRTDRTVEFFAGNNNPHLQLLSDILMTYVMYNFDLGYVQGMSDLLSPILCLMANEVEAFWCFTGFMEKVGHNFDLDQAGMKEQLMQLHTLLAFVDPELTRYLDEHDSGNMFFCFRWILVLFKREFSQHDIMRLWEVLWTDLPCKNFHLLISIAILDTEKEKLIGRNFGFTEILKHINDLSQHIELQWMIAKAEGIYQQIITASHLTNAVRSILGVELVPEEFTNGTSRPSHKDNHEETENHLDEERSTHEQESIQENVVESESETIRFHPDSEVAFNRSIDLTYY